LVTPHYVVDIYSGGLRLWDLEQLVDVSISHRYRNGQYRNTEIKLTVDGTVKVVAMPNIDDAEEALERIGQYRKLFIEASVRNDIAYINSNDDFTDNPNFLKDSPRGFGLLPNALCGILALIFAIGLMACVISLNKYFDDKKSWETAQSINRASGYRNYSQTHPHGRWTGEADQALQSLYDAAEQKYKMALTSGVDPKAAAIVSDILQYARTTGNFRAHLTFVRHNDVPTNLADEIKKEFNVKNVLPLGDTFSAERMEQRQVRLKGVISDAFKQVIPDDILEISDECTVDCVNIAVNYEINFKNSIYFDVRQNAIPDTEKTFNPGISINWNLRISIPNRSEEYRFELTSLPADEISYDSESDVTANTGQDFANVLNAEKDSIYDSMVASSFDDFRTRLVSRLGIEVLQTSRDPGPSVAGPTPSFRKK